MQVILDLSFPTGNSVNHAVPKSLLEGSPFKMSLPSPDSLASKIRELGSSCLLYKVDLKRAYRQLRSDPFDWALLGVQWADEQFIDISIPFGLRHGASACQRTTTAIANICHDLYDSIIFPYVDDSAGLALPDEAFDHYYGLLGLMDRLGIDPALAKCQPPPCSHYHG